MDSMMGMAAPMPPTGPAMGMPMPMGAPPEEALGAGQSPYPSTDPAVVAQILSIIGQLQQEDHANLQMQQDGVLSMLMSSLMPPTVDPMMDAGFVEGGGPVGAPDEMMM